jgi:hypothetical protein
VNEEDAETKTDAGFSYRHLVSFLPSTLPMNPSGGKTMAAVVNGGVRVLDGEHSQVGRTSSRRRGAAEGHSRAQCCSQPGCVGCAGQGSEMAAQKVPACIAGAACGAAVPPVTPHRR